MHLYFGRYHDLSFFSKLKVFFRWRSAINRYCSYGADEKTRQLLEGLEVPARLAPQRDLIIARALLNTQKKDAAYQMYQQIIDSYVDFAPALSPEDSIYLREYAKLYQLGCRSDKIKKETVEDFIDIIDSIESSNYIKNLFPCPSIEKLNSDI